MRPRISYLALALSAATGGANVNVINNGTIDTYISANLPGGANTFMVTRLDGLAPTIIATNIFLPWE